MTMIDTGLLSEDPTHESAVWSEVEDGFWVGSTAGVFLGSVEHVGTGYVAHGPASDRVGEFSSLARAQHAITAHG